MNTPKPAKRVDAHGKAFKGSQYQLQRYVNEFPSELERTLRAAIPDLAGSTITWRSPLASDSYREYRDAAFLDRIGLTELRPALLEFWPRGGPVWDGLAQIGPDPRTGVLLVEAKSYPAEMVSRCRATPASRERIEAALAETRRTLGVRGHAEAWTETYYQLANRIAHVHWLRRRGVRAWLVSLCFVADDGHVATSADAWTQALSSAAAALGLTDPPSAGLVDVLVAAKGA